MELENLLRKGKDCLRKKIIWTLLPLFLSFYNCEKPTSVELEPEKNNPPVITSSPVTEVVENQNYK